MNHMVWELHFFHDFSFLNKVFPSFFCDLIFIRQLFFFFFFFFFFRKTKIPFFIYFISVQAILDILIMSMQFRKIVKSLTL
jgi:hypothetical protein